MSKPLDAYREGYEQGLRDSIGGNLAQAVLGKLRDDPGGHFAAGYHDGAAGRKFNPPNERPVRMTKLNQGHEKYEWVGMLFLWLLWFAIVPVFFVISLCRKQPRRSEIIWRGVLTVIWLVVTAVGAYQLPQSRGRAPQVRANNIEPSSANPVRVARNPNPPTGRHEVQTNGEICAAPSAPCISPYKFRDNDLSFHLPQQLVWQNNYYSTPFYAVILKSHPAVADHGPDTANCGQGVIPENERQRIQTLFPAKKVFASTFGCYMTPVAYLNTNDAYNFVAVYAGQSVTEAQSLLAEVRVLGQFQGANVRKMQVVLQYGD
jgi:hypothetical protein